MGKKEILLISLIGLVIFLLSIIVTYNLISNDNKSDNSNKIIVGNYSLDIGTYKGEEVEYDSRKEVFLELSRDKINSEDYIIKGNKFYVNNQEMYEVIADNKILLLAGGGIEYEYIKK